MKLPFKLPHKAEQRNRVVGFLIGLITAMLFSVIYLSGALTPAENFDLDLKFKKRKSIASLPVNKDFVFLEIDDATLFWEEIFPDDPEYYNEVIAKLGSDEVGALGLVFGFDYSHTYGRKMDKLQSEALMQNLAGVAGVLDSNAQLKANMEQQISYLGEMLAAPDAKTYSKDLAAKLNEMVYSEDITNVSNNLGGVAGFASTLDLNSMAPDREKRLAESFKKAKNVYMVYEAKSVLETPYNADDLRNNKTVRDMFIKIMHNPAVARPENPDMGAVFDAYQNIKPRDLDKLIAPGPGSFDSVVTERVKRDREEKGNEAEEFLRQNSKYSFDMPKEVEGAYTAMRHMRPAYPELGDVAAGQGIGRAEFPAHDGTLRLIAPAVTYDGRIYPHIDLLLAMKYLNVDRKNVEFRKDRITLRKATHPRSKVKKDIIIPLDKYGDMMINWASVWEDTNTFQHKNLQFVWSKVVLMDNYPTYKKYAGLTQEQLAALSPEEQSAFDTAKSYVGDSTEADYEQAKKEINDLRGKIIVLGRTAVGTAEINPTPLEPRYHYIGLHANALNTIVEDLFVHEPSRMTIIGIFFLLAVSLGFIGGLVHTKSSVLTAGINFVIMVVVAAIYTVFSFIMFAKHYINVPLLIPLALIVFTFLFVFLYRFLTEEKEKLKMKSMFSTYVNKEVVDSLIENPDLLKLGGEWAECTVFFSDVAGFTSISESLKPEELVELLNEYLTAMTDLVFKYGGTLDKYIGDAIVAIYGAPFHFKDHAVNACYATLEMQEKLAAMRVVWKEQGRHELTARCGINTGKMIAGNMGSTTRFNYTVMGDNVELGEHLESGGKTYGTIMTISEETRRQAGDRIIVRWLDIITYGGHDKPFRLYELLAKAEVGISEDMKKGVEIFEEAVMLYFHREWDKALEKYNEVYKYIPKCDATKQAIGRCEKMKANPPGPEFDELLANAEPI